MTKDIELDFDYTALPNKEKPNKFKQFANKFFYSYWYFIACVFFCTISWYFNIPDLSFGPILLMLAVCLICVDDITPVVPVLFMIPACLPRHASFETSIYLAVYLIPVVIGVVYHIVKYKPNKRLGNMFWPMIAVLVALIMGGLGSNLAPDRYVKGLPTALGMGAGGVAVYLLVVNYTKTRDYDFKQYFAKCMVSTGVLLGVLLLLFMFANPEGLAFGEIEHDMIELGGYISNNLSHLMIIVAPFGIYLAVKDPKRMIFHLLTTLFVYATSLLTYSRGCLLFTIILAPIGFLVALAYTKEGKKKMLAFYGILLAILIIFAIVFRDKLAEYINMIANIRDHSSLNNFATGRIDLYREARLLFQSYPLFGTGLGYISDSTFKWVSTIDFLWFHSTFWQILGSLGLFGFVMYGWLYFVRYKMMFVNIKKDVFFFIILISFLSFDSYALIDASAFLPMPFVFLMAVISGYMELAVDKQGYDKEKEEYAKYSYMYN